MTKQFKNPKVDKIENKTASDAAAPEKASHVEQRYDKDHQIFSK
jgi:hypothetical protein